MYYDESFSNVQCADAMVVDLRSDTFTKPTKKMREAMCNAEVGDDVFEEDPTVKHLEGMVAEMVGMEAGIFVCSGTMSNLIAIMNHCDVRGCEAYCADSAHCLLHEQCGASQLAGVSLRSLRSNADGSFDIDELRDKLRHDRHHEPISKLVVVENPTNGLIVPQSWIEELVSFCKPLNLKLHMDGARLWNASIGSGKSPKEIVTGFDSVSLCLSKALGAPVGSVLCGNKQFIAKARRIRKVLGGGLRQVGVLAAAGIVALENIPLLKHDHTRAFTLAFSIDEVQSKVFSVDLKTVQTNMVFVHVDTNITTARKFAKCLREVDVNHNNNTIVKCLALTDSCLRFVLSYETAENELMAAIDKIKYVITKLDPNL